PFGGFIAKLTILKGFASIEQYSIIAIILIISVVEAVYFFRLLGYRYDSQPKEDIKIPLVQKLTLGFIAFIILYLGVYPNWLLDISHLVASSFLKGVANV
ncbi:MAG: hypothetical protein U9O56_01695, partial [Campylobacterota bacterium]|nr:hypothetical protein [Campylobacterota bacterium]